MADRARCKALIATATVCPLYVQMDGQDYELEVAVAPVEQAHVYVRPLEGGPRRLVPAAALTLRGFVGD